jgi:hydroxymethylpyrimidine/phosphomethylpyrimidine kinase
VATRELVAACTEVLRMQRVAAIKVGALGSQANARAVGELLSRNREIPSVVDTVLLPTRGRSRLLPERALSTLRRGVIRHATLVTANAPEAEAITGLRVTRLDEAHAAAQAILALGPRSVLIKGGHLSGKDATDLLALRGDDGVVSIVSLRAPRLHLGPTHGGGCALASLIAARLALGHQLEKAVSWAKRAHHSALENAVDVGGEMRVLFA